MVEIEDKEDLNKFLREERAVLLFYAKWSGFAKISKRMIECLESGLDVRFYFGEFEGDRVSLGQEILALGVPKESFAGNGSISFFERGKHLGDINCVVGEGNWAVVRKIKELYGTQ